MKETFQECARSGSFQILIRCAKFAAELRQISQKAFRVFNMLFIKSVILFSCEAVRDLRAIFAKEKVKQNKNKNQEFSVMSCAAINIRVHVSLSYNVFITFKEET